MWHYRKGAVASKAHTVGGASCTDAEGVATTVETCDTTAPGSGASVF
jgi:hypothetical protein